MTLLMRTERLSIAEAVEDDVDALLAVALSNTDFTGHHEGSAGEPGHFDRHMLERDLAVAWMDPARHPLVLRDITAEGRVVGWAEVLDEHPNDGVPWIGLLEVHQEEQRKGYGSEALGALLEWARSSGAPALRLGVDEGNDDAMAFWTRSGFEVVDHRARSGPTGKVRVEVMEVRLGSNDL